jgi:hypothetical protein
MPKAASGFPYFFGGKLVFDVFVKKRTRRAFAFNIKLKYFPQPRRHVLVTVYIAGTKLYFQRFFFFGIFHPVNGLRLGSEEGLAHGNACFMQDELKKLGQEKEKMIDESW